MVTRAQSLVKPVIGYLAARGPSDSTHLAAAFRRGLAEIGYVEGQNVIIEQRWALGQVERLPTMASELVRRPVTVLVSTGGENAATAAKAATSTIPIVFASGSDPVEIGLVASYSRPGGNATGVSILTTTLEPKRLELMRELVPAAEAIGVLVDLSKPAGERQARDVQVAARAMDLSIQLLRATTDQEIEAAFEAVTQQQISALMVAASPFFDTRRDKLIDLAARRSLPTLFQFREYAVSGGLMSYGIDLPDAYRKVGVYAGRILKGERPADLPVELPTKFELVINLKTAKALGITIPPMLLARADEVIE
jgi:putative tryptophan/tyrosine transport system substrate-binding protein